MGDRCWRRERGRLYQEYRIQVLVQQTLLSVCHSRKEGASERICLTSVALSLELARKLPVGEQRRCTGKVASQITGHRRKGHHLLSSWNGSGSASFLRM